MQRGKSAPRYAVSRQKLLKHCVWTKILATPVSVRLTFYPGRLEWSLDCVRDAGRVSFMSSSVSERHTRRIRCSHLACYRYVLFSSYFKPFGTRFAFVCRFEQVWSDSVPRPKHTDTLEHSFVKFDRFRWTNERYIKP